MCENLLLGSLKEPSEAIVCRLSFAFSSDGQIGLQPSLCYCFNTAPGYSEEASTDRLILAPG